MESEMLLEYWRRDTIFGMGSCIQISHLSKRYGKHLAVNDLSFEVETGEVMGFLGLNGAGKSTTLYMLAGLVRPTSGSISIFGKNLHRNFLSIAPQVGVLVERPAFYDYLSARENLKLSARLAGRDVTVDRALDRVGLLSAGRKRVGVFSTGMRQRLGLAQALLLEPALLILDEPTNGLDPEATRDMLELLKNLADESQVTILISSHMLHEVEQLCDRVVVINKGHLVSCDRTDALLSYDEQKVEVLLDSPEAAAKKLSTQTWVESVEIRPGRLEVKLREDNAHQLTAFLVASGYRLTGVIPRQHTLQEYFLKALNR
jgi:ABC-2 type transport system ATP-binding protein